MLELISVCRVKSISSSILQHLDFVKKKVIIAAVSWLDKESVME